MNHAQVRCPSDSGIAVYYAICFLQMHFVLSVHVTVLAVIGVFFHDEDPHCENIDTHRFYLL